MERSENETGSPRPPDGLFGKSLRALKWNYIGVAARVGMQFVAQIALARLLGPDVFGVIAALLLIIAVCNLIAEMGLGAALVQAQELADRQIRAVFGRLMLAAVVVAMGLFFLRHWLADVFATELLAEVLPWVLPAFFLQAATVVSQSLLRRQLDFKTIQMAQISGYGFGYLLTGVPLAVCGAGVWSLVAAWIVQNLICFFMMYAKTRHSLWPEVKGGLHKEQRFGLSVLLTNLANWVIENVDNLMVGRFFGASALGPYAVAYNLVRTPANHMVVSIQQVIFPVTARSQHDLATQKLTYLAALWVVSMLAFPVFIGAATVAPTVVSALYGTEWDSAAPLLRALACAMPLHAVMAIAGPVLWGRGEARQEFQVQLATAVLMGVSLLWAAVYSVQVMAWCVCAIYLLRAVWIHRQVAVMLGIAASVQARALTPPLLLAALVCSVLVAVDHLLCQTFMAASLRLGAEILVAAGVLVSAIYVGGASCLPVELREGLPSLLPRLPLWLRKRFVSPN